ncbi:MAG: MarP family serine protease, partial [Actinomycetota bacterium]
MSWVDAIVAAALGVALWTGYRRGALLQLFSWGGFVLGLILGMALAPHILSLFGVDTGGSRGDESNGTSVAIYTIVAWLGIAFLIEGVVAALGIRVRKKITHAAITKTDQVVGSVIAGVLSLAGSWLLGVTFARGPSPAVASAIKDSAILRAIDSIAPPPPAVMAEIGRLLRNSGFPEVFSQLNPSLAPGVEPPPASLARDAEILAAADITYKVEGTGCGGVVDGSGFPVGSDMVVTAAHVVAGTDNTRVIHATNGKSYRGTVVYMDKDKDIAIVHVAVPGRVFVVEDDHARKGTDGAAIGYPGGGKRTISPARVRVRTSARGMDIYSRRQVTRTIYVLRAQVRQGNSGGPLVDEDGRVRGMIFAAAQDNPEESYALAETEIFRAVD